MESLRGKTSEGQGATGDRPKLTAGARLRKMSRLAMVRRASPNRLDKSDLTREVRGPEV